MVMNKNYDTTKQNSLWFQSNKNIYIYDIYIYIYLFIYIDNTLRSIEHHQTICTKHRI